MAYLTNFSFEFFYEIFTEDASLLLLYHGAKKSKMTKNSNQGGGGPAENMRDLKKCSSLCWWRICMRLNKFPSLHRTFPTTKNSWMSEARNFQTADIIVIMQLIARNRVTLYKEIHGKSPVCGRSR